MNANQTVLNDLRLQYARIEERDAEFSSNREEASSSSSSSGQSDGPPFGSAGETPSLQCSENEMGVSGQDMDPSMQVETIDIRQSSQSDTSPLSDPDDDPRSNGNSINNSNHDGANEEDKLKAAADKVMHPNLKSRLINPRPQKKHRVTKEQSPPKSQQDEIAESIPHIFGLWSPAETAFAKSQRQAQASNASMMEMCDKLAIGNIVLRKQVEALYSDRRDLEYMIQMRAIEFDQPISFLTMHRVPS